LQKNVAIANTKKTGIDDRVANYTYGTAIFDNSFSFIVEASIGSSNLVDNACDT
jgi:hypothetical protein